MRYRRTRYIPKNALPIEEPGLGVAYVYPIVGRDGKRKYGVIAYVGNQTKALWHESFKADSDVDARIAAFFDGIRQHHKLVADRRAQDFAGHSFNVGDIVTNSWGYDQTNVDWYRVSKTTKNYVWLKPVASTLDVQSGAMAGQTGLALDENLNPIESSGPETKHRASGSSVTMRHGSGSKYTGGTLYESWYA